MGKTVQARIDEETKALLEVLCKQLGWNESKVLREGIKALAAVHPKNGERRIIGLGKFESGINDLATNKKHLRKFGKD